MKVKIKPVEKHLDAEIETGCNTLQTYALGNTALVAGAFDDFGLENVINQCIGKICSHVRVNSGVLVKALVVQMINVLYQNLFVIFVAHFDELPIDNLVKQDDF